MQKTNIQNDVVAYTVDEFRALVLAGVVITEQHCNVIDKKVHGVFGGDTNYTPRRRGEYDSRLHSERNSRILRAYQQGRHIAYMAKAEGLTERHVLRIVNGLRSSNTKRQP